MAGRARYLYAVTRGVDPSALSDVAALSGETVDVVEHEGLLAVLSTVDLDEFGEDALRANLEQLDWLEETARTHDAVIKAVSGLGPVAPMRLATIFLDDASVRRRLDEWYLALEQVLDRVQDRREWSVKVIARPSSADPLAPRERPASGADYLRQKKESIERRAVQHEGSQHQAQLIHEALAERAVAIRLLPAQDPRLSGHDGTMLINGAYLVAAADGDQFVAEAEALSAQHPELVVDVRGPWPPYSFAMLEQR